MTTQQIKRKFENHEEHGQICRLCMSEESLEDVFKDDQLTEWIWKLLAIKISGDDGMSQVICTICRIRLTEFHQFRLGCHEVQEVLQALIPYGTFNSPVQTDSSAINQLQRIGVVDDSLIRCEVCLLVFNDEKQLTNHKTIHDHENQKNIEIKSELVENVELKLQGSDRITSFKTAGISSHIQDEEMKTDQLGIEDCLVVEEVKIETPADDEVVASVESQHNKIENEEVYRCDICQNVYSNRMQLKNHRNYHKWKLRQQANPEENDSEGHLEVSDSASNLKKEDSKDRIHQCDECPKTFLTRKVMIVHRRSVHGPRLHRCDICDVQFSLRFEMTRHLHTKKHMDMEQEIQKRVNEKSSNQNEMVGKAGGKHDNNKTMKDSNLPIDDMLAKYRSYRLNKKDCEKLLKCNECYRTFSNIDSLNSHKQYHKPKKYFCHVCERPCRNGSTLKRHLATHVSPVERQQATQVRVIASVPSDNETNENEEAHKDPSKSDKNSSELPAGEPAHCDVCHEAFESTVHLSCHKRFFCRQQKNMHMKSHKPKSTASKDF